MHQYGASRLPFANQFSYLSYGSIVSLMLKSSDYANRLNIKYVVRIYICLSLFVAKTEPKRSKSKTIIFMISIKHAENVIITDQIKWSPGAS